jgi:hypothetical protein
MVAAFQRFFARARAHPCRGRRIEIQGPLEEDGMLDRRRSPRVDCGVDVCWRRARHSVTAKTRDLGLRGMCVLAPEPPDANQMVRLTVLDPADGGQIELLGVAAWSAAGEGFGFVLKHNPADVESRWVALVRRARGAAPVVQPREPAPATAFTAPARVLGAAWRAAVRTSPVSEGHPIVFLLDTRPEDLEAFERHVTQHRGAFFLSYRLLPVGTPVIVRIVHPVGGRFFDLRGVVVSAVDSISAAERALGVRFADGIAGEAWTRFLAGAPAEDEAPEVRVTRIKG